MDKKSLPISYLFLKKNEKTLMYDVATAQRLGYTKECLKQAIQSSVLTSKSR